ncbi:hypothetical protein EBZ39_16060 [bacterium]|nr:hypothetical protein [bacterium]
MKKFLLGILLLFGSAQAAGSQISVRIQNQENETVIAVLQSLLGGYRGSVGDPVIIEKEQAGTIVGHVPADATPLHGSFKFILHLTAQDVGLGDGTTFQCQTLCPIALEVLSAQISINVTVRTIDWQGPETIFRDYLDITVNGEPYQWPQR